MLKTILTLSVAVLCVPVLAQAATVTTTNVSSSNTGGVVVGENGQSVHTGNSSASSAVYTHVNSNREGSTVDIHVETEHDGQKSAETRHYTAPAGEPVVVKVATSSVSAGTTHASASVSAAATVTASTTSAAAVELSAENTASPTPPAPAHVWSGLFSWLPKLWNMFGFFN